MLKNVSIFIGNPADETTNLELNSVTYTALSVTQLCENNPEIFSLVQNPNGQTDLSFQLDNSIVNIVGSFREFGTGNPYNLTSVDYVGGQPKTRCPQCP